jgi:hypothetical protein
MQCHIPIWAELTSVVGIAATLHVSRVLHAPTPCTSYILIFTLPPIHTHKVECCPHAMPPIHLSRKSSYGWLVLLKVVTTIIIHPHLCTSYCHVATPHVVRMFHSPENNKLVLAKSGNMVLLQVFFINLLINKAVRILMLVPVYYNSSITSSSAGTLAAKCSCLLSFFNVQCKHKTEHWCWQRWLKLQYNFSRWTPSCLQLHSVIPRKRNTACMHRHQTPDTLHFYERGGLLFSTNH